MKTRVYWRAYVLLLLGLSALVWMYTGTLTRKHVSAAGVKVQLCMVIDGSGSVNSSEWAIMREAIAESVNDTVPHDGSVELTIVQFGYSSGVPARTEVHPTVIDETNYIMVASQVLIIPKMGGSTPTGGGLYLAWKEIRESARFADAARQVINLATDNKPNVRNYNASADLDGHGGTPDASDDVIATVNAAVDQGLDELDIEGIGLADSTAEWFSKWIVQPQPGIEAPPFSKPGWIRTVADVSEFANTVDQKMRIVITGETDIWVPSVEAALLAGAVTVGVTSLISSLASAVGNPQDYPSQMLAQKISSFFPDTLKKWLHEFISSKRKLIIGQHTGSPFMLTKIEVVSYVVALSVLTFAFSYAKTGALGQILVLVPTVLATSIVVEFAKNYSIEIVARKQGVWTEHRLWYFGLATFLFSSLVFRVPFSSPSRLTHYSPKFTKRSFGLVSSASVLVALAFAVIFYAIFLCGFALIGSIGLVMCLTMAFFDSIPIPPMNGKDIYDWSKVVWVGLFMIAFVLYVLCLLLL